MIKFPIHFEVVPHKDLKFRLNCEWTVLCKWKLYEEDLYLRVFLIPKVMSPYEIPVFGKLSIWKRETLIWSRLDSKKFSKLLKIFEITRLATVLVWKKDLVFSSVVRSWCLRGVIVITSKCDKSACKMQSRESEKHLQTKSLVQLSDDFERLLDPRTSCLTDVKLICGRVSIPAHKIILSARSPFFAAMFKHPMKENIENQVFITDLDPPVFKTMLKYIYSGRASNLTVSTASDLLVAADKYQLQDLKEVCCDFLKSRITLENVLNILVLGDRLEEGLKSCGVNYIYEHCKDFSAFENTEDWKTLKVERPVLVMDILSSLMKCRDKKKSRKSPKRDLSLM